MKTINNTLKTKLAHSIFFSGLFITGISSAAGSGSDVNENDSASFNSISSADREYTIENWMTDESNFSSKYSFGTVAESTLYIESWMINEGNFDVMLLPETVADANLNIENWMTDENTFTINSIPEPAPEKSMEIESWMTDGVNFDSNNNVSDQVMDGELMIEDWMLENHYWK
jgi:hypothetical protein